LEEAVRLIDMLKDLINAQGISGEEMAVRQIIRKEMKSCADEIMVDKIGNLIVHKKGAGPTVMLAAHMDEVGLMVRHIEADGKIMFDTIGGIEAASLVGQRVGIGKIRGVITVESMSKGSSIDEVPSMEELYIDTGLGRKELERKGVEPGSYVVFDQHSFSTLGSEKIISGKALDDRLGCHILIELAKKLKKVKHEVYYVFTVQEEIGLYGAKVSAYNINPDWAIVIDVTDEDPKIKKMGDGPCIMVKDAEMLGNKCINGWLKNIAKKKKIPYQLDVSDVGTTDALTISLTREAIPTAVLGPPIRNMHTATSIAHLDDINNTVKLLEALLKNPPKVCIV
jgi:endoglucanase